MKQHSQTTQSMAVGEGSEYKLDLQRCNDLLHMHYHV